MTAGFISGFLAGSAAGLVLAFLLGVRHTIRLRRRAGLIQLRPGRLAR